MKGKCYGVKSSTYFMAKKQKTKIKSIFIHFKKKSKLVNIIIHAWTSAIPHENKKISINTAIDALNLAR